MNKNQVLVRVLLSPLILIFYIFLTGLMMLFPLAILIVFISFFGLILEFTAYILSKGGTEIKRIDPFINHHNNIIGHFLGITIIFWGSFYATYIYVKHGVLMLDDKFNLK